MNSQEILDSKRSSPELRGYVKERIEKMQATLEAARGMNDRPSLSGALKENAGKVKSQPVKAAAAKDGPSR